MPLFNFPVPPQTERNLEQAAIDASYYEIYFDSHEKKPFWLQDCIFQIKEAQHCRGSILENIGVNFNKRSCRNVVLNKYDLLCS